MAFYDFAEKTERPRRFFIMSYIPKDNLVEWLKKNRAVQHWALIYHDKDVWTKADENDNPSHKCGEPKEPHTHILLYYYDGKTNSAVEKHFKRLAIQCDAENPQNTFVQICSEADGAYRYLVHKDDPQKTQYQLQDIVCDDTQYWQTLAETCGLNDSAQNTAMSIVQDLIDGTPYRTMVERYGRDFVINARHYQKMALNIRSEECQPISNRIDDDLIRAILSSESCPFYKVDIYKFYDILDYLKKVFTYEFDEKNADKQILQYYLSKGD